MEHDHSTLPYGGSFPKSAHANSARFKAFRSNEGLIRANRTTK
ncbi:hypothetical protein TRICHSKD4_5587 [Roseibium sp. TrichSKD4]|nr:hypothetical protein TRICHSKD4_5587 [Roseibium sp. TrichSKD4]